MTKAIARLIKVELDWMRAAQGEWGQILVDPYLITVGRHNTALKRIFADSELNPKDADHWKLLLARIAQIVYRPRTAGPGRPVTWTPKLHHEMLKDSFRVRLEEPKKGIEYIAEKVSGLDKWQGYVIDRERIQNALRQVRGKAGAELDSITDHQRYRLQRRGKLLLDIAWAFSKQGKRELTRRRRLGLPVERNTV